MTTKTLALLSLAATLTLGVVFSSDIKELYEDRKASALIGTCYSVPKAPVKLLVLLKGYDSETNLVTGTILVEVFPGLVMPNEAAGPRDALESDIASGNLVPTECPNMEESAPSEESPQ